MGKIRINNELLQNSGNDEVEMDAKQASAAISANDYELIDFDGVYEANRYGLRYHINKRERQINQ